MKLASFAAAMLAAATLLPACGSSSLELTLDGSKQTFSPSTGIRFASTKTFSEPDPKGGFKSTKASAHTLYLTNFAPKADVMNLNDKTTPGAAGNVRVQMSFIGPEGSEGAKMDTPLPTGAYQAATPKFQKVESVSVTLFADGKQKQIDFDRDKTAGTVKITAGDGDTVAGEIDLRDGKNAIKGSFKTKLQKP